MNYHYSLLVERGRTVWFERWRKRAGSLERSGNDNSLDDGRRPRSRRHNSFFVSVPGDFQWRTDLMSDRVLLHRGSGRAERRRFNGGHDHLLGHGTALEHGLPGRELGFAVFLVGYGQFVPPDARRTAEQLFDDDDDAAAVLFVVRAVVRRRWTVSGHGQRQQFGGKRRLDPRSLRHGLLIVEYVRQRF